MAFEVYDRKNLNNSPAVRRPIGTIRSNGALSINPSAFDLIERPESVELLFDPQNKVIGLRRSEEYHAYKVASMPGGWKAIATASMLEFYGVKIPESTRYEITFRSDGIARINLRKPVEIVSRARTPKAE
jgi:hypothetical protein